MVDERSNILHTDVLILRRICATSYGESKLTVLSLQENLSTIWTKLLW